MQILYFGVHWKIFIYKIVLFENFWSRTSYCRTVVINITWIFIDTGYFYNKKTLSNFTVQIPALLPAV